MQLENVDEIDKRECYAKYFDKLPSAGQRLMNGKCFEGKYKQALCIGDTGGPATKEIAGKHYVFGKYQTVMPTLSIKL